MNILFGIAKAEKHTELALAAKAKYIMRNGSVLGVGNKSREVGETRLQW